MNAVPAGCSIEALDDRACRTIVTEVVGPADSLAHTKIHEWLLAHCDNGVVWGKRAERRWDLSVGRFAAISASLTERTLQQLRLFDKGSETLIWRTAKSSKGVTFAGRVLRDEDAPQPFDPLTRTVILLGDRLMHDEKTGTPLRDGIFSLVGDATGSCHAVPIECAEHEFAGGTWPLRLEIRDYLQEDESSGALRIAASRLVRIFKEVRAS
jgi:hypothetical protein